jgi:hypothetical protein
VRLWDASSRELVSHLKYHSGAVTDLEVGGVVVGRLRG